MTMIPLSTDTKPKSQFLIKVVDWWTDRLGFYERLTSLFLECRVGIDDGLIDGLWQIDGLK